MKRLDLARSPRGLYHFDRSLEDLSGHGLDLSGTALFHEFLPQVFALAPGSDVRRPGHDPLLALTGPMTLAVDGYFVATPSGTNVIFASFTNSGETAPTHTQWQLGAPNGTQLRWIHENDSGVVGNDEIFLSTGAIEALPRLHTRFLAHAVREADGSISLYLNGRLHGRRSAPLAPPVGGTTAFLRVMFGSTAFGLLGLAIIPSALSPAEVAEDYYDLLGEQYGPPNVKGSLWSGAITHESATVVAKMSSPLDELALTLDDGVNEPWQTAPVATDADLVARFELTGLEPGVEYAYSLPNGFGGRFRTLPVASGEPASFRIAFGGDAVTDSSHAVFHAIEQSDPLLFLHLGDLHYLNITANSAAAFHDAYDRVLASPGQHRLYRRQGIALAWDDHDGAGGNNTNGSAAGWPAACAVYRSRVPHYPLVHPSAIYQSWDIGRVRFILTDQRSQSSVNTAADNASKTMLGSAQKAWWKNLVANSPNMLIVWICPRWFALANHQDSWNNFSTERAELCDWIEQHAHGRVVVIEADQHTLAIDDGSHVDHATGGGEPLRCFRAAPLDQTPSALAGTYSHGEFNGRGQFGVMEVEDEGGSEITVTWRGFDSAGTELTSYTFPVAA